MLALLLVSGGCSWSTTDHEYTDDENYAGIYISLRIQAGLDATRVDPIGGEYGEGTQNGENNESVIYNLALFFYPAAAATSLDDTSTTALNAPLTLIYVNDIVTINQQTGATQWSTNPIAAKALELYKAYRLIVVANANLPEMSTIKTLGQLRNYQIGNIYTRGTTLQQYDNFTMSSRILNATDENSFAVTGNHVYSNPLPVSVKLDRLTARLDLIPYTSTNAAVYSGGTYTSPVTINGTLNADKVTLTGITPINILNQKSYLLKHMAAAGSDGEINAASVRLVGKETPDAGNETGYVLEPTTSSKTKNSAEQPTWYDYYYKTVNSWNLLQQTAVDGSYILCYIHENTMTKSAQLPRYSTGLSLKTIYQPSKWWVDQSGVSVEKTASVGATFYTFRDKVYGDLTALARGINQWTGATSVTASTAATWTGVKTYTNGVCYYSYWIRHSNDNTLDTTKGIMEYAIVRNNIYRVIIDSFSSIGSPQPVTEETQNEDIIVSLYVIPWNIILNKKIYI